MSNNKESIEALETVTLLLQNLLAIELWRGGLGQVEIGRRLGMRTASVNKMLRGVNREIPTRTNSKE